MFCHSFDLSKRLESGHIAGSLHASPVGAEGAHSSRTPLKAFLDSTRTQIEKSAPGSIHRIVVPGLLSPTVYGSAACHPREVLQFLQRLRALLRRYHGQVVALITIPVSLFPRSTGLTRWVELLSDGVFELTPLQRQSQVALEPWKEDKSQGLIRVHSLPIFHEKGGGLEGSWSREDLSFKLSASSGIVITPYSLPPVGDDGDASASATPRETEKDKLEF